VFFLGISVSSSFQSAGLERVSAYRRGKLQPFPGL